MKSKKEQKEESKLPKTLWPYKAVILTPPKEEKLPSGIIVPNTAEDIPTSGEVLMIGPIPIADKSAELWEKILKVGDNVRIKKGSGMPLEEISDRHRFVDIRTDVMYIK